MRTLRKSALFFLNTSPGVTAWDYETYFWIAFVPKTAYNQLMLAKASSASVLGIEARPVEVEVNAGYGDPATVIVGLPDAAVKESRDRVATAITNSGYAYPLGRLIMSESRSVTEGDLIRESKTDLVMLEIAKQLRKDSTMMIPWIVQRLQMGSATTLRNQLHGMGDHFSVSPQIPITSSNGQQIFQ